MTLLNRTGPRARSGATGDRSVAVILLVLLALVFAPVALLHLAATAAPALGGAAAEHTRQVAAPVSPKPASRG